MHKYFVLCSAMLIGLASEVNATKMYACLERDLTGFKGKEMKPTRFTTDTRFILSYNEENSQLKAEEKLFDPTLPNTCQKSGSLISCMHWMGNMLLNFDLETKEYRWAMFGYDGDSTGVSWGTCEDF